MTTLEEEVALLEAQLAKESGQEVVPEEPIEEAEEIEEEQTAVKEEPKEEPKEEQKPEQKEQPVDNAAIARMRWEAAEERRKREALEAEIAALKNPAKPLPDKEENWEAHAEARIETTEERLKRLEEELAAERAKKEASSNIEQAKQEFDQYEQIFKKDQPEYEDARTFLVQNIARSIKMLNPYATTKDIISGVETALLTRGRDAVLAGVNPAAAIFQEAKAIGYTKQEQKQEPAKPKLEKLATNRPKTAGMAGSGGGSNPLPTVESALKLSNAEFSRLSEADFARLEAEARA